MEWRNNTFTYFNGMKIEKKKKKRINKKKVEQSNRLHPKEGTELPPERMKIIRGRKYRGLRFKEIAHLEMDSNTTRFSLRQDILQRLNDVIDRQVKDECRDVGAAVIMEVLNFLDISDNEQVKEKTSSEPSLAVVYITVMLLFFAASVFVVLSKYMKKESESSRLEQFYQDYQKRKHSQLIVQYDSDGKPLSVRTTGQRCMIALDIEPPFSTPTELPSPMATPKSSTTAIVPSLEFIEHDF